MGLILMFLVVLKVGTLSSNDDSEGVKCQRDTLIEAREGQQLNLRSSVKQHQGCTFIFQHPEEGFECCYGATEDCDRQHQRDQVEERCQSINVDSRHSATCSAAILSVNKAHAGFYKVFNTDGVLIQACHLVVETSETNPWKVAFFVLNGILFLCAMIRLIVVKSFVGNEKHMELLHMIKHQLHKISLKIKS